VIRFGASARGNTLATLAVTGHTHKEHRLTDALLVDHHQVRIGSSSEFHAYVTADECAQIAEAWRLAGEQIRANEISARLINDGATT
jgi:hypothetical protein